MDVFGKMRASIQGSFDQIRQSLDIREKLLIRQLQVLERQANLLTKDIEFLPENEDRLLHLIRVFGKFNVHKMNVCSDFLTTEDYICPRDDHVLINKQLILDEAEEEINKDTTVPERDIQAIMDDNANTINESLINLILSESRELVGKSSTTNNKRNKDTRHGNSKKLLRIGNAANGDTPAAAPLPPAQTTTTTTTAKSSSSVVAALSSSFSHSPSSTPVTTTTKRLIDKTNSNNNNNSGSHPTTGTGGGGGKKKILLNTLTKATNLNNNKKSSGPRRPTAIVPLEEIEVQAVPCDFYNRLINDNKLLRNNGCSEFLKTPRQKHQIELIASPTPPSSADTSSTSFKEFCTEFEMKRLMEHSLWDTACDGLAAVVDANGNVEEGIVQEGIGEGADVEDRPKQIQLWLKQIIHESELEPMQNQEVMEFSRIQSP